jgi:peptide/nickel transport system permease protein
VSIFLAVTRENRHSFWSFVIKRLSASLIALWLLSTVVFFLIEVLIPYDHPAAEGTTTGRYLAYMGGLITGDLGRSYTGEPVIDVIIRALPTTLLIFGTGGILAYLLGSWLGRLSAWSLGKLGRGLSSTAALALYTMFPPLLVFLLAHFGREPLVAGREAVGLPVDSLQVFRRVPYSETDLVNFGGLALLVTLVIALLLRAMARRMGWRMVGSFAVPASLAGLVLAIVHVGIGDLALDVFFFRSANEVEIGAGSPVLVVIAFLLLAFGEVMFIWQAGMVDERTEDYVLTARAKAVPEREVRDHHAAPNAWLPVLARSFSSLPILLTGLIIIEYQVQIGSCALAEGASCVYWSGGLSTMLFTAVRDVDVPLILGVLITMGVLIAILRLVAEIAHAILDPRIRLGDRR